MAYRVGTSFRAAEMRSLTPHSFDLDLDPPTVTAGAAYSKRRSEDVQPIRTDLAKRLRPWLKGNPTDTPVFDLLHKTAKMLRFDLKAANIPHIDEAGRVVDEDEAAEVRATGTDDTSASPLQHVKKQR